MKWTAVVVAMAAGCAGEPKPGETGYEDCDEVTLDGEGYCAPVQMCCTKTGPTDKECKYVAPDGRAWFCDGEGTLDCVDALEGAQGAVCTGA